jgi:hypothetical protein
MNELLSLTQTIKPVEGLTVTLTYTMSGGVHVDAITDQMPSEVTKKVEDFAKETIHTGVYTYLNELVKATK